MFDCTRLLLIAFSLVRQSPCRSIPESPRNPLQALRCNPRTLHFNPCPMSRTSLLGSILRVYCPGSKGVPQGIGNLVCYAAGFSCFFQDVFTEVCKPEHGAGFSNHQHFTGTFFHDYIKPCSYGLGIGGLDVLFP